MAVSWGFIGQPIAKAIQYTSTVWAAPGVGGYTYIVGLVKQIPIIGYVLTIDPNFLRWYLSDFAGGVAFAGIVSYLAGVFKLNKWERLGFILAAVTLAEFLPSGHHPPTGLWLQGWGEAWQQAWQAYRADPIDLMYAFGGVGVYYLSEWLFGFAKSRDWSIKNGLLALWRWIKNGRV